MSEWQPIKTAPLNPVGKGVGPWLLLFNTHDHIPVIARWVAGEVRGEWVPKLKPDYVIPQHYLTHWMPLPNPPENSNERS